MDNWKGTGQRRWQRSKLTKVEMLEVKIESTRNSVTEDTADMGMLTLPPLHRSGGQPQDSTGDLATEGMKGR